MTQRSVTPSVTVRADVLAQAHARSREFGLRASEAPDFHPLRPLVLRETDEGLELTNGVEVTFFSELVALLRSLPVEEVPSGTWVTASLKLTMR